MDKETLSNYGWVVVVLIVLALMISLATPFGSTLSKNIKESTTKLMGVASDSLNNVTKYESFEGLNSGEEGGGMAPDAGPTVVEGANQEVVRGEATTLSFRSSAAIDTFQEVRVDGEVVARENYDVTEGSTIITFKESYLNSLAPGDHTIDIVSTVGVATSAFKVVAPELDLSTVDATLENNSWETIQKVVAAGKAQEAGWLVGDTKTLTINGETNTATLIGINHDGVNTATFMIAADYGIGSYYMNSFNDELTYAPNAGGWRASEMRRWLNEDVYDSMTDTKDYIKAVSKNTNNIGQNGNSVSATSDKVFLLSAKEVGAEWDTTDERLDVLNDEGVTYEWFVDGGSIYDYFWLRSPHPFHNDSFFSYWDDSGELAGNYADCQYAVQPAFVIG